MGVDEPDLFAWFLSRRKDLGSKSLIFLPGFVQDEGFGGRRA